MTRRSALLLALLSATWGSSYLFIGLALRGMSAPVVVLGRLVIGAAVLAAVTTLSARRAGPAASARGAGGGFAALRGRWPRLVPFAAAEMVAPYLLIAYGENRIDSGLASTLVSTQMMWLILLTPLLAAGTRVRRTALAGVAVGFVGVMVLADPFGGRRPDLVGMLLVTGAAASYAVGALLLPRLLPGVPALPVTAGGQAVAAVLVAPLALTRLPPTMPSPGSLAALLVLGVACTAVGFGLFNTLVGTAGPGPASLVSYLAPGVSVLYGVTLLGEPLRATTVLGLLLVLGGSALTARRARTRRPARATRAAPPRAGARLAAGREPSGGRFRSDRLLEEWGSEHCDCALR